MVIKARNQVYKVYTYQGQVWNNSNLKSKDKKTSDDIKDEICHSRHTQLECKFFASGVKFSKTTIFAV